MIQELYMEERALKAAAVFLMALMCIVCVSVPLFPRLRTWAEEAREARLAEAEFAAGQMEMEDLEMREEESAGNNGVTWQLNLRLPEGTDGSMVSIHNDYVTQTIRIGIPGTDPAYFDSYSISGSSNHIDTLSYNREGEDGVIEIVTDRVYELDTEYDSDYYYFNFLSPQEIYDKVVVIDAGHGGRAAGATKKGIREKDINLAIVLRLREIFEERGGNTGVYFTRTDDSNPTFDQRVQLANRSGANLFISVHNNSLGNGRMSATSGTQVMYSVPSDRSQRLAEICLEEVTKKTGSRDRGLVEGDSIFIIRSSEVPVALIEVGFMTNREELALLATEDYQRQAAEGIYSAIQRAFAEGY